VAALLFFGWRAAPTPELVLAYFLEGTTMDEVLKLGNSLFLSTLGVEAAEPRRHVFIEVAPRV